MKKGLIALMTAGVIALGANVYAQTPKERWEVFDKWVFEGNFKMKKERNIDNTVIDHFLFSALGNACITGIYNKLGIEHPKLWAAGTIFALGVGKEILDGYRKYDANSPEGFSTYDLAGDCVGIAVTYPFLTDEQKLIKKTAKAERERIETLQKEAKKRGLSPYVYK